MTATNSTNTSQHIADNTTTTTRNDQFFHDTQTNHLSKENGFEDNNDNTASFQNMVTVKENQATDLGSNVTWEKINSKNEVMSNHTNTKYTPEKENIIMENSVDAIKNSAIKNVVKRHANGKSGNAKENTKGMMRNPTKEKTQKLRNGRPLLPAQDFTVLWVAFGLWIAIVGSGVVAFGYQVFFQFYKQL